MKLANPKLPSWQSTLTRIQSKAEIKSDDEIAKINGGNSLKWHPQAVYSQKKHKIGMNKKMGMELTDEMGIEAMKEMEWRKQRKWRKLPCIMNLERLNENRDEQENGNGVNG
nr:hypothetical protein [Tanacetum cinerariifolium]